MAMASPTEKRVIDEIEFVTGKRVFPYVALAGPLMRTITAAYEMRDRGEAFYVGPKCPPRSSARLVTCLPDDEGHSSSRLPRPPPPGKAVCVVSPPALPTAPRRKSPAGRVRQAPALPSCPLPPRRPASA